MSALLLFLFLFLILLLDPPYQCDPLTLTRLCSEILVAVLCNLKHVRASRRVVVMTTMFMFVCEIQCRSEEEEEEEEDEVEEGVA